MYLLFVILLIYRMARVLFDIYPFHVVNQDITCFGPKKTWWVKLNKYTDQQVRKISLFYKFRFRYFFVNSPMKISINLSVNKTNHNKCIHQLIYLLSILFIYLPIHLLFYPHSTYLHYYCYKVSEYWLMT